MIKIPSSLKRLLSIGFFAAIVFFGAKTCAVESADCEIVFRLRGEPLPDLEEMEALLYSAEEELPIGEYRKYYPQGSEAILGNWPLVISAGTYKVEVILHGAKGDSHYSDSITLVDGESISFYVDVPRP